MNPFQRLSIQDGGQIQDGCQNGHHNMVWLHNYDQKNLGYYHVLCHYFGTKPDRVTILVPNIGFWESRNLF